MSECNNQQWVEDLPGRARALVLLVVATVGLLGWQGGGPHEAAAEAESRRPAPAGSEVQPFLPAESPAEVSQAAPRTVEPPPISAPAARRLCLQAVISGPFPQVIINDVILSAGDSTTLLLERPTDIDVLDVTADTVVLRCDGELKTLRLTEE